MEIKDISKHEDKIGNKYSIGFMPLTKLSQGIINWCNQHNIADDDYDIGTFHVDFRECEDAMKFLIDWRQYIIPEFYNNL